jgi:hypothetical protein
VRVRLFVLVLVSGLACSENDHQRAVSESTARLSESDSDYRARQFLEQASSAVSAAGAENNDLFLNAPLELRNNVEAVREESTEFMAALSDEIGNRVCAGQLPEDISTIVYIMSRVPAVVTVKAIDCIVDRHLIEDHLLWTTIAAWRRAGTPSSAGIERVRTHAIDLRTVHRLLSPAELKEWKQTHVSENVIHGVESAEL